MSGSNARSARALGPCGPGHCEFPWALVGRDLVGWALLGQSLGSQALMAQALVGRPWARMGWTLVAHAGPLWAPVPGVGPTVFKLRLRLGLRAYIIRYV